MAHLAVLIATKNRPERLKRALQSIIQQTKKPDTVFVISDCDTEHEARTQRVVQEISHHLPEIRFISNQRTKNLSGALNTGLYTCIQDGFIPESTCIAILDDDDAWKPEYLAECLHQAESQDLDVVVAGLIRHERADGEGVRLTIPNTHTVHDFFIGNPHVQGSNLFIRLSALLQAGGFDESLDSTTDRDVCIRLLDLEKCTVGFVRKHLVHHWALPDTGRLSEPHSPRKLQGLTGFYQKYAPRMTEPERCAFKERALDLFGYEIEDPSDLPDDGLPMSQPNPCGIQEEPHTPLVIGFYATRMRATQRLLGDLLEFFGESVVSRRVIICENSPSKGDLEQLITRECYRSLNCRLISCSTIDEECDKGTFGSYLQDKEQRKGISSGRTILHHYLYEEAKRIPGSVVWILDDDIRLDYLTDGCSKVKLSLTDLHNTITRLKGEGISISVGKITGDAPLPVHSTMRVQLLDIFFELKRLEQTVPSQRAEPDATPVQASHRVCTLMEKFPDYYYDYSGEHTAHLEMPLWQSQMNTQIREDLIRKIPTTGFGKNITRPVNAPHHSTTDASLSLSHAIIPRGGNTLVLNPECLREFPNIAPRIGRLNARRGDTFWCILNKRVKAYKLGIFPLAVRQERTAETADVLNFDSLLADFYGNAFVRAMDQYYERKIQETGSIPRRIRLSMEDADLDTICAAFNRHLTGRLTQFVMNAYRIQGLIGSIEKTIQSEPFSQMQGIEEARTFLGSLKQLYSKENIRNIALEGRSWEVQDLRRFLGQFKDHVKSYRGRLSKEIHPEYVGQAKRVTEKILYRRYGDISGALRYVGHGHEGAVFTDGTRAYKYFFNGLANFQEGRLDVIRDRVLNNATLHHMSRLTDIIEDNGELVFVLSYEDGRSYTGGHLQDIFAVLAECRNAGIAFTNFHPRNFVVSGNTLNLVDIGDSIVPYNENEFLQMCRRAYLMYRWHFRPDISDVMALALFDPDLPELCGFDYFFEATKTKTKNNLVNERIVRLVSEGRPSRILDYGCGRGSITEALAEEGFPVIGYDRDRSVLVKNGEASVKVHYIGSDDLMNLKSEGKKFDRVICSLVLCTISDNEEVADVIRDIRTLVTDDGEAIIALCNPFSSFVPECETHVKLDVPRDASYQDQFVYHKRMRETGRIRKEIHRPFSWYKHQFHRQGFEISGLEEVRTTDIPNLSPSSDFLILKLRPLKIPRYDKVSLLIRAGAMEWQTIDFQIRHIVSQLEGPQIFLERIVITDNFTGPFARQYAPADTGEFNQKLERLVAEGVIDRVVVAPDDPETIEKTYKKWFGITCTNPRCENGQPTFMALYGFDQCQGDYILQMDSDCLVARQDRDHDYLGDMINVFRSDPDAVTVSFNIAKPADEHYTRDHQGKKWRAEVRCSLISRTRLAAALTLTNHVNDNGVLQLSWHRALDTTLAQSQWQSYRGGDRRTFFIHVPNGIKPKTHFWFTALKHIEQRRIPDIQNNNVDLAGILNDWAGLLNTEYVFILRGKDVPVSKLRRCMDSVVRQKGPGFGLVFIDAGSSNPVPEYISEVLVPAWGEKARVLFNYIPLTSAENNAIAIREICSNPESIIVTLDMDDALIGTQVIECLREKYLKGADLTVGSMVRTDKWCDYPATFADPRKDRGGNVWQHLRSFRKYLFDAIPESYLKIDGEWIPSAEDWAFMIPMVEMAEHPAYIRQKLYFYEPTGKKDPVTRAQREGLIGRIVGKSPLNRYDCITNGGRA